MMSRTVNGEVHFNEKDKSVLRKMIYQSAEFSGVNVLTYCVMHNHFHVLVEIPDGDDFDLSDQEILRRYRALNTGTEHLRETERALKYAPATPQQVENIFSLGGEEREKLRAALLDRMYDLSEFVKTFKQRFSIWYNSNHDRYGPLWSDRFKSVLVEGQGTALQVIAAYIDLNPVRAGLVEDPADYRFSGYGDGEYEKKPLTDLKRVIAGDQEMSDREVLLEYRMLVLGQGQRYKTGKGNFKKQIRGELEDMFRLLRRAKDFQDKNERRRLKFINNGEIFGSWEFVYEGMKTFFLTAIGGEPPLHKIRKTGLGSLVSSKRVRLEKWER